MVRGVAVTQWVLRHSIDYWRMKSTALALVNENWLLSWIDVYLIFMQHLFIDKTANLIWLKIGFVKNVQGSERRGCVSLEGTGFMSGSYSVNCSLITWNKQFNIMIISQLAVPWSMDTEFNLTFNQPSKIYLFLFRSRWFSSSLPIHGWYKRVGILQSLLSDS